MRRGKNKSQSEICVTVSWKRQEPIGDLRDCVVETTRTNHRPARDRRKTAPWEKEPIRDLRDCVVENTRTNQRPARDRRKSAPWEKSQSEICDG